MKKLWYKLLSKIHPSKNRRLIYRIKVAIMNTLGTTSIGPYPKMTEIYISKEAIEEISRWDELH